MSDISSPPFPTFTDFATALGGRLDLDGGRWHDSDLLVDTVGWDSLVAVEVVAWLEELGIRLPDELLAELRTLGDLHHYTRTLAPGRSEAPVGPAPRVARQGRRVRLVPLTGAHQAEALDLFTRGSNLTQFRFRGTTPSPESFARLLWDRVLCQFAVSEEGRMVALVSAFEADMRNRHVHVAVVSRPDAPPGMGLEGLALLIEHLFAEFDFRKVYAEVMEPNAAAFRSGLERVVAVEGRLVDHEYMAGDYQDMLILSITRERWEAHADRLFGPT